jgi:hypothetical protein
MDRSRYTVLNEFHPEETLDEKMLEQRVLNIHHSPVRRGYVDNLAAWRYSGCWQHDGGPALVSVEPVIV